ncbi:MAG: hypothetical protein HC878_20245 [Leptolyngbyaceae cyanobacterium SL_5_14]|nr:hypothetical protein [Leptolyngbyaceae cyanobacterium SL_5_14]
MVTQAAWIKSLTATYVRAWEGRGVKGSIGGLFGAPIGSDEEVLPWSRSQQAAFLIFVWQCIGSAVTNCREPWAESLRSGKQHSSLKEDPAFAGSYDTHLNTNIGTRGILHITNDFCYLKSEELGLRNWVADDEVGTPDDEAIRRALESLAIQEVATFLRDLAVALVEYDWRTSSAPGLSRDEQRLKAAIRGGAGYKELRIQLLEHLANTSGHIGQAAQEVINALGY